MTESRRPGRSEKEGAQQYFRNLRGVLDELPDPYDRETALEKAKATDEFDEAQSVLRANSLWKMIYLVKGPK